MTLAELVARLERRAADAEREGATATVANVYRLVLGELAAVDGNGNGHSGGRVREGPETLLTAREVAARLKCSVRYIYAHAATLPFTVRIGGLVRFSAAGLDCWLTRRP